jgi:hypothetical protein
MNVALKNKPVFHPEKSIRSYNFDWDDNVLNMPTTILLFHKTTKEVAEVTTHKYALVREKVGKEGEYQNYEVLNDDSLPLHSYMNFRDPKDGRGVSFLDQVKQALALPNSFGPSFDAFCEALNDKRTAKWTTIITARGHSKQGMYEALVYLQNLDYFKYLPPIENIHPVSSKEYQASAGHPSQKKLEVLFSMIDRLNLSISSKAESHLHYCGFSDDDAGTYKMIRKAIEEESGKGRWDKVKITLYFTGKTPEVVEID